MPTENQEAKVEEVIRRAGAKLLEYWPGGEATKELGDRKKEDGSIVTNADFAANDILLDGLAEIFPEDAFYSEEGDGLTDPNADAVWIIDPLDGTKYFTMGTDGFAILVARSINGSGRYGICYFPVQDIYLAGHVERTSILNGQKTSVSSRETLEASSLYVKNTTIADTGLMREHPGHGALMVQELCAGTLDGIIIKLTTHQEWDIAPYLPIIEAAGGKVTDVNGDRPTFHHKKPEFEYLIASNGHVHDQLLAIIDS